MVQEAEMERPRAIAWFDRLWWGATLAWVGTVWVTRQRMAATLAHNPQTAPVAGWAMPVALIGGLAITALVWFAVSRRASRIGKWLVVLFAVFDVLKALGTISTLVMAPHPHPLSAGLQFLATALTIAAAAMLFRADALWWFGELPDEMWDGEEEADVPYTDVATTDDPAYRP